MDHARATLTRARVRTYVRATRMRTYIHVFFLLYTCAAHAPHAIMGIHCAWVRVYLHVEEVEKRKYSQC